MLTALSEPTETTPAPPEAAGDSSDRPPPDCEERKALEMDAAAIRPAAARLIPPDTRHLAAIPAEESRP